MTLPPRLAQWIRPALYLGANPVSLIGAALTTSAGLTLIAVWLREVAGGRAANPYTGIFAYLILPVLFVFGLILMPAGALWRRRRLRRQGLLPAQYPLVDLNQPALHRAAILMTVATVANLAIVGTSTYRAVEYMDSSSFCGQTCHQVMEPEYTAFVESPHSRVGCVQCHIGPGASGFVRSKLSGARQVFAVSFGTYSRPIPSPVHELRPARETCEQCHWPQKFHGDKLLRRTRYSDDEANTPLTSVLMLRIGGQRGQGAAGIHGRHLDGVDRVRYVADARRQVISRVSYVDDTGKVVEYLAEDAAPNGGSHRPNEERAMDCTDCHNRPTHAFEMPERAVDRALTEGRIDRGLPFVRKTAVELLRGDYRDHASAAKAMNEGLAAFYRERYPQAFGGRKEAIDGAAAQLAAIYRRNVFPQMKVTWGTYPNHSGHEDFPGCFRCHDGKHRAADGRVITQDCEACHAVLAMEETDPKVLADLGLK